MSQRYIWWKKVDFGKKQTKKVFYPKMKMKILLLIIDEFLVGGQVADSDMVFID